MARNAAPPPGGPADVGERALEIIEQLRARARELREYATRLVDEVDGMRDLVLTATSEGLARQELEERLAVLEAERDVLARQLGKVRREAEDEIAVAREKVRALETELSLAGSRSTQQSRSATSEGKSDVRQSAAVIDRPVVEKVGARARHEALKSRHPRHRPSAPPAAEEAETEPPRAVELEEEALEQAGTKEWRKAAKLESFLEERAASLPAEHGRERGEAEDASFAGLFDEKEERREQTKTSSSSKPPSAAPPERSLEDLLANYLDEE
jgi:hypothetical protein